MSQFVPQSRPAAENSAAPSDCSRPSSGSTEVNRMPAESMSCSWCGLPVRGSTVNATDKARS
ncbi:MAG: hypothetical protein KDA85_02115, partial [Planctomycetaceae bacterium]|nr:hypothetical protein [Planctomycetaceae bacterium]